MGVAGGQAVAGHMALLKRQTQRGSLNPASEAAQWPPACPPTCRMAAASVTTVLQLSHMSLLAAAGAPVASWRTAERSVRSAAGAAELQGAGGAGQEHEHASGVSSRRTACLLPKAASGTLLPDYKSARKHQPTCWGLYNSCTRTHPRTPYPDTQLAHLLGFSQKSTTRQTPSGSTSRSRWSRARNRSATSCRHCSCTRGRKKGGREGGGGSATGRRARKEGQSREAAAAAETGLQGNVH